MWAGRRTSKGKRSTRPGRENQADPVERSSSRNRYGPDPRISIQALRPVNRRNREAGHTTAPDRMHQAVRKMLASTGASTHGSSPRYHPKHPRQRIRVHRGVDHHPHAVAQHDLHAPARHPTRWLGRIDDHRDKPRAGVRRRAISTTPLEQQAGVNTVAPRHRRG